MNTDELIPASWFYLSSSEKVKFNWFLYEYACKLYEHIEESRGKRIKVWKAQLGEDRLARFCAYFSKRMRRSVQDRNDGRTDSIAFYDRYVSDYCHESKLDEINAVMKIAFKAWGELLETCSACPNMCLSDPDCYCGIFDRMERGGYHSY